MSVAIGTNDDTMGHALPVTVVMELAVLESLISMMAWSPRAVNIPATSLPGIPPRVALGHLVK
jgi:hypothetical protein